MPRLIDISIALEDTIHADPPGLAPSITYRDHRQNVPSILSFFPGLRAEDLPEVDRAGAGVGETARRGAVLDVEQREAGLLVVAL